MHHYTRIIITPFFLHAIHLCTYILLSKRPRPIYKELNLVRALDEDIYKMFLLILSSFSTGWVSHFIDVSE